MNINQVLLTTLLIFASTASQAAPKIVASIAPLQYLTAMVTSGITHPLLIIPASQSPHDFILRPSAARAIASADLVIWLGSQGEPNLARALTNKAAAQIIDTSTIDSITRYPARDAGLRSEQDNHRAVFDPHVWLSPQNAIAILLAVRDKLIQIDPDNTQGYTRNTLQARNRIETMHQAIDMQLKPVKHHSFIVMHDSLQYFERTYNLTSLGSLGAHDGYTPGIKRLAQFRDLVQRHKVTCALTEINGSHQLILSLDNTAILRTTTIDVLGVGLASPKEAYFDLMTQLANNIKQCLSPNER